MFLTFTADCFAILITAIPYEILRPILPHIIVIVIPESHFIYLKIGVIIERLIVNIEGS